MFEILERQNNLRHFMSVVKLFSIRVKGYCFPKFQNNGRRAEAEDGAFFRLLSLPSSVTSISNAYCNIPRSYTHILICSYTAYCSRSPECIVRCTGTRSACASAGRLALDARDPNSIIFIVIYYLWSPKEVLGEFGRSLWHDASGLQTKNIKHVCMCKQLCTDNVDRPNTFLVFQVRSSSLLILLNKLVILYKS